MSIKNSGEINKDGTRTYDEITVAEQDMILNKFNSTKPNIQEIRPKTSYLKNKWREHLKYAVVF